MPRSELAQAASLYREFTGNDVDEYIKVNAPDYASGLVVGQCDGVLYSTNREGINEKYIHKFKKSARPTLAASHDGKQLMLIGGNFQFTDRGIVDN